MQTRALARLLAVGLSVAALHGLASGQEGAPPLSEGALRVLTYNVYGIPGFVTGDDTLARQAAIRPLLKRYDVAGIQEDFQDEGHRRLVEGAPHGTQVRFAAALPGRIYGPGLAILARPRAVEQFTEHYRTYNGVMSAGSDGLASKGFHMVRLLLAPGVEIDVYNTHMDAGGSAGDMNARAAQVSQIATAMQTVSAGRAVVLLGDTNLSSRRERDVATLERWLTTTGLRCACLASRKTCCGRIDRILVRSGVGVDLAVERWSVAPGFKDAKGKMFSDHDPLEATLRWRRRAL